LYVIRDFLLQTVIEGKIKTAEQKENHRRLLLDQLIDKTKGEDFELLKRRAKDREE